jgi:SSS family transporter
MSTVITLSLSDWLVIAGYVTLMFAIPIILHRPQRSANEFFLAGRGMHWAFVGISMYASLFSTISFVANPGEAYKNGMLLALYSVGYTLFVPLAIWIFLRFFYNTTSFSAYEYLERRFNVQTRTLGSIVFLISRSLYAALVLYSAAKIFQSLLGWPAWLSIIVIMNISVVYSFAGGMRTLIVADTVKTVFLMAGLFCLLWKLAVAVGFNFSAVWSFAAAHNHTLGALGTAEFYSFDPHLRLTLWVLLFYAITTPLANYGTDQLFLQKVLVTDSYRSAVKAILTKTLAALPISLLFYYLGLLLYYYYNRLNSPPPGVTPDAILGHFINHHLAPPLPGIVTVAMLAAMMASLDSTINALSTIFTIDIVERFHVVPAGRLSLHALGRSLTIIWGVVLTALALVMTATGESVETTIAELSVIWSSLWGVLLMVVLGGIFTRWITGRAAAIALSVGIVLTLVLPWPLYYATPSAQRISFIWVGVPGWIVTLIVMVMVSAFDSKKSTSLDGLTWKTVTRG